MIDTIYMEGEVPIVGSVCPLCGKHVRTWLLQHRRQ